MTAVGALMLVSCGDDAPDAGQIADQAGDLASQSAVRVQAETLRGVIKERGDGDAAKYRSISMLSGAVDDLPGDTTVSGLDDRDGDGQDDDGKLELVINGERACVAIEGTNTTVTSGAC